MPPISSNGTAAALVPTSAFIFLWSSGAIFSEIGLQNGSPLALLISRYGLALFALLIAAVYHRQFLPKRGSYRRVMITGALIAGLYSISYLMAMQRGLSPGILATILGVQPMLTALLTEKRLTRSRFFGLSLALCGLALIVNDGLSQLRFDALGLAFAALALIGITMGSIVQKGETQPPWAVLPLQYMVALLMILMLTPFLPVSSQWNAPFMLSALWLGLIVSVAAIFLFYRLIAQGNLVNVTSLFYLVPAVTAAMDWAILGNIMSLLSLAGLGLILAGLAFVFRKSTT